MPLHLIRNATPEDAERHLDAQPGARWRATAEQQESAFTAAIAMQRSYSAKQQPEPEPRQHLWADALHPAEAATDIGADMPARKPNDQERGEAMGNFIGWGVVALIALIYLLPKFIALFR